MVEQDKVIKNIRKALRPVKYWFLILKGYVALIRHKLYFASKYKNKHHDLDGQLIVSLTSYPVRFKALRFTIESIIAQTVKPDKILLFIAHDDIKKLPKDIFNLEKNGLEIVSTEDIRSFKKLIPTIKKFPEAYIVTADDDVYYEPNWLEDLLSYHDGNLNTIVCHVAHGIVTDHEEHPVVYNDWKWCISEPENNEMFMPVGVGGVLYSPKSLFRPEVLNQDRFTTLCPYADDMWFFFMGKLNGAQYIKTPYKGFPINWPGSQKVSLSHQNTGRYDGTSRNDEQLSSLIQEYGNVFAQNK